MNGSRFSGETRAAAGLIATFERNGKRWSRHFHQVVVTRRTHDGSFRRTTKLGDRAIVQAIEHADNQDAMIVCLSTPETIYRDLQGSRNEHESDSEQRVRDTVRFPEQAMLAKGSRLDLWIGADAQRRAA